jgi:hypothetical protein
LGNGGQNILGAQLSTESWFMDENKKQSLDELEMSDLRN